MTNTATAHSLAVVVWCEFIKRTTCICLPTPPCSSFARRDLRLTGAKININKITLIQLKEIEIFPSKGAVVGSSVLLTNLTVSFSLANNFDSKGLLLVSVQFLTIRQQPNSMQKSTQSVSRSFFIWFPLSACRWWWWTRSRISEAEPTLLSDADRDAGR